MSLVNDMLRDLERSSARGTAPRGTGTSGLRPASRPPRARHPWRAGWLAAPLAALALGGIVAEFEIRMAPDERHRSAARTVPPALAPQPLATPPVGAPPPPTASERRPIPRHATGAKRLAGALPALTPVARAPVADSSALAPASPTSDEPAMWDSTPSPTDAAVVPKVASAVRAAQPAPRAQRARQAYREGIASLRSGDPNGAETALRKALRLHPALRGARQRLAALLVSSGQLVEAAGLLEEGLARTPHHPPFAAALARIRVETGGLDEAIRLLEGALPEADSDPGVHAFLAALYQRRGDPLRAARSYGHALRQNPDRPLWWMGMGVSFESLGRFPDAFAAYQMAWSRRGDRDLPAASRRYLEARLSALDGRVP